jgi:hypothetical protein
MYANKNKINDEPKNSSLGLYLKDKFLSGYEHLRSLDKIGITMLSCGTLTTGIACLFKDVPFAMAGGFCFYVGAENLYLRDKLCSLYERLHSKHPKIRSLVPLVNAVVAGGSLSAAPIIKIINPNLAILLAIFGGINCYAGLNSIVYQLKEKNKKE